MRIVVLTWEYPPRIVGDMAYYAQSLSQELAKRGFETHVVTYNDDIKGEAREAYNLIVHRVGNPVPTHINILTWTLSLSVEFERACADIYYDIGPIDLFDCHEWIAVPATTSLSNALRIPFVMTVDSLEEQRSIRHEDPMSLAIRHFERLGTSSSSAVIVKTKNMKEQLIKLHNLSAGKIQSVPRDRTLGESIAEIYGDVRTYQRKSIDD